MGPTVLQIALRVQAGAKTNEQARDDHPKPRPNSVRAAQVKTQQALVSVQEMEQAANADEKERALARAHKRKWKAKPE